MANTLAEIRTLAKDRANMEGSDFIADPIWDSFINASLAELHDLLVAVYADDYYLNEQDFTTTNGVKSYSLPADFYKVRGVDALLSGTWVNLHKYNWNKRNQDTTDNQLIFHALSNLRYRVMGSNLIFSRLPDTNTQCKLWYTPKSVVLVNDTDTFEDINGYLEYVIIDVAIKALVKEESEVRELMAQKQAMKSRLEAMAANRDANEPESVYDVYDQDDYSYPGRTS